MRPEKLTFVCVVYRNDFDLLSRLLNSINEYVNPAIIEEFLIILNEPYKYVSELKQHLNGLNAMSFTIRQIWSNEIWPEQDNYGWYSQQMLKILAAEKVNTEWYMIHDAKDHYIEHCDMPDYFDASGSAYGTVNNYDPYKFGSGPGIFEKEYTNAYELWSLDFRNHKTSFMLKYTTPFPVRTEIMCDMIKDLRDRFHNIFYKLLLLQVDHKALYTEFALISAYTTYRGVIMRDYVHGFDQPNFTWKIKQNKDLRRRFT